MGKMNLFYLVLFAFLSLSSVGCSVPPVADRVAPNQSTAWEAYLSCQQAMGPRGSSACNNVGMPGTSSYTQYTTPTNNVWSDYASTDGSWNPAYRSYGKTAPRQVMDSAYQDYLAALDERSQAALTEEWTRLARSAAR